MIAPERIIPTLMALGAAAASIGYAACGQWRMAVYWLAASVLNWTVTYG